MDEGLLRAARSGDERALAGLCEALYPRSAAFGAQLPEEGADDLTQATRCCACWSACPSIGRCRARGSKAGYFASHTTLFLDEKRRSPPFPLPEREIVDPSPTPEESALCDERALAVRRAVCALPDEMRALITMRYELDMGYQDIASALRMDVLRVKWRLHDARKRLKITLREVNEP